MSGCHPFVGLRLFCRWWVGNRRADVFGTLSVFRYSPLYARSAMIYNPHSPFPVIEGTRRTASAFVDKIQAPVVISEGQSNFDHGLSGRRGKGTAARGGSVAYPSALLSFCIKHCQGLSDFWSCSFPIFCCFSSLTIILSTALCDINTDDRVPNLPVRGRYTARTAQVVHGSFPQCEHYWACVVSETNMQAIFESRIAELWAKSKWIRTTTANHFLTLLSFNRHGRVIRLESSSYLSIGPRSCMGTFIRMFGIRRFTSFLSTICDVLSVYINMRVHIDEANKKCLYYQTTGRNRSIRSNVQCKKSIEQPSTVQ